MADFGSDIGGVWDISVDFARVTGREGVAVALLRRLTTPRGQLIGAPLYGYDLRGLIGSTVPASVVEQRVTEQCALEERIKRATVTVTMQPDGLQVLIRAELDDGPFGLTLDASSLTVRAFLDGVLFAEE